MLGDYLKEERKAAKLSQTTVSEQCCSVRQLSRIENNQSLPSLDLFILLIDKLDIDVAEVVTVLKQQLCSEET